MPRRPSIAKGWEWDSGKNRPEISGEKTFPRDSLAKSFATAPDAALFLLQAPAGFGKTHVLNQWAFHIGKRTGTTAWINLDVGERSAFVLLDAIRAAVAHAGVQISEDLPSHKQALGGTPILQQVVEIFLSAVAAHRQPILLVLDNYQKASSAENSLALQVITEKMPPNLRLAISSREAIAFPSFRALLQKRLFVLGKEELAFSREEIKHSFGSTLTPSKLKELHKLTEGWPAALRIAETCQEEWRGKHDAIGELPSFVKLIRNYVRAEVLTGLGEDLQDFLRETTILEVIEPRIADAVRDRQDSASLLSSLSETQTLMHVVDINRNAWRLPTLVRQAINWELLKCGAGVSHMLNTRAGSWFEDNKELDQAVYHYLAAEQPERAVIAVERYGPLYLAFNMGDERAAAIIRAIPKAKMGKFPRMMLVLIYLDFKAGLLGEARHQFNELSKVTLGFTKDRDGGNDALIWAEAACVDLLMELYLSSGISDDYLEKVERNLANAPQVDEHLSMLIHMLLAVLNQARGNLNLAHDLFLKAEKLNANDYSAWEALWLKHHYGALALARGELHEARHRFHLGLRQWRAEFPGNRSFPALTNLLMAEIDYEFDSLAEAQARVDEAIYTAEHVEGWFEHYLSVYETLAMLTFHAEGPPGVEALLSRLEGVLRVRRLMENFFPALRMRLAILSGAYEAAREIADKNEFLRRWMASDSHSTFSWREWDLIGLALGRLTIQEGKFDITAHVLDRLEKDIRLSGRLRSSVRVLILRAVYYDKIERREDALSCLGEAMRIAEKHGYLRCFLDEGDIIKPFLNLSIQMSSATQRMPLAQILLKRLENPEVAEKNGELLSAREHEVLRELGLGHSSKLIARKMALSESTVKFHIRNIFRKLNVRKRASAIAEAHRRGIAL